MPRIRPNRPPDLPQLLPQLSPQLSPQEETAPQQLAAGADWQQVGAGAACEQHGAGVSQQVEAQLPFRENMPRQRSRKLGFPPPPQQSETAPQPASPHEEHDPLEAGA